MATVLPIYACIWLDHHPDRSEDWLRARYADGFDIHHIDGDRNNNDINNLVLIEKRDHMRLHLSGSPGRPQSLPAATPRKREPRTATLSNGETVRLLPRERARTAEAEYQRLGYVALWRKLCA